MARLNIILSDESLNSLDRLQKEKCFSSRGQTIEFLLEEYKSGSRLLEQAEFFSKMVSKQILKDTQEKYDVLRIRTGFADKHLKLLLDIINHLIISRGHDVASEQTALMTDNYPSNIYEKALKKYDHQLTHFQQNADRKRRREKKKRISDNNE